MIYIAAHVRQEDYEKFSTFHFQDYVKLIQKWDGILLQYPKDPGIYYSTLLFESRYNRDHFIMDCEHNIAFRPEAESMRYNTLREGGWIE